VIIQHWEGGRGKESVGEKDIRGFSTWVPDSGREPFSEGRGKKEFLEMGGGWGRGFLFSR